MAHQGTGRLTNLQGLRALAAWAVVGHHVLDSLNKYLAPGRIDFYPPTGSYGVEVFFVISGYVMMRTTAGRRISPLRFLLDRVLRITPLYWFFTLLAYAMLAAGLRLFGQDGADPLSLSMSLLYLPLFADGRPALPVLFTGWTLNYEMLFYLAFAACLPIRCERCRTMTLLGLFAMAAATRYALPSAYTAWLGRDIIWSFALGCLLWPATRSVRIGSTLGLGVLVATLAGLSVAHLLTPLLGGHVELLVGILAFAMVGAGVLLENSDRALAPGALTFQGDVSYALYLIHPFALQAVGKLAILLGLTATAGGLAITVLLMIASAGVSAALVHLAFERPVQRLTRRLRPGRPPPTVRDQSGGGISIGPVSGAS